MSLVDEVRAVQERISARLRELEPLVREYHELQKLAAEMGIGASEGGSASGHSEPRREAPPPEPAIRRRSSSQRRGGSQTTRQPASQRSAGGDLAARVLAAAHADPGKTVADYAEALGVSPTALYRPVRQLTTEGALVKRARQLFPS
jgi:hypothetical protein